MREGYKLVREAKGDDGGDGEILDARLVAPAGVAINGAIRFRYTIQLGYWDMRDPTQALLGGTWVPKPATRTYSAFSSAEDMNTFVTATGAIGTGNTVVTRADGTINGGSCKLVKLPVNGYCQVKLRGRDRNGNKFFTIVNFANSGQ